MQRSNDILMARVREAQYQELANLRDGKALRGLMYVHLKKGLEATPIDWIDCPDRSANVTPGNRLSYGMRRDVQLLLARIRTDLDSFSDCEADALMLSGYLMTRSDFADCITGFPVKDVGPQSWRFRKIEAIATDATSGPDTALLRRALTVAEQITFKPLRTFRHLNLFLTLAGLVMLSLLLWFCSQTWGTLSATSVFPIGRTVLLIVAAGLFLVALRWFLSAGLRYRNSFTQILVSTAMCAIGWAVLQIHLRLVEPIYLRYGPKYRTP
jgi:hypothetical protein